MNREKDIHERDSLFRKSHANACNIAKSMIERDKCTDGDRGLNYR